MYCSIHGIDHSGSSCPRCDAEARNEAVVAATGASAVATIAALREADFRRANPGDFVCPHCRYTSLRRDASRCPLCHGEIRGEYWAAIREQEMAVAEQKRAAEKAAAAEWARAAPQREAAARATAAAAERAAADERQKQTVKSIVGLIIGLFGGAVVGFIAALIVGVVVWIIAGIWMNDSNRGGEVANAVGGVVFVIGVVAGAIVGWMYPKWV